MINESKDPDGALLAKFKLLLPNGTFEDSLRDFKKKKHDIYSRYLKLNQKILNSTAHHPTNPDPRDLLIEKLKTLLDLQTKAAAEHYALALTLNERAIEIAKRQPADIAKQKDKVH